MWGRSHYCQRLAWFLALLVSLSGCMWRSPEPVGESGGKLPFALQVLEEVNDGSTLHLQVQLEVLQRWRLSDTLVHLIGVRQGQVQSDRVFPLATFLQGGSALEDAIEVGVYPLSLSLPLLNATDYQLELLWGAEASPYLKRLRIAPLLKISRVTLQPACSPVPCSVSHLVEGELINQSKETIEEIQLGIGLQLEPQMPGEKPRLESEKTVALTNLRLAPGQSRPLRLTVDQDLTPGHETILQPVVRVVSAEE